MAGPWNTTRLAALRRLQSSIKTSRRLRSRRDSTFPRETQLLLPKQAYHQFFTSSKQVKKSTARSSTLPATLVAAALFVWWLYPSEDFAHLAAAKVRHSTIPDSPLNINHDEAASAPEPTSAWTSLTSQFESVSLLTEQEWSTFSDKLVDYILPEWSRAIPGYVRKLQRELSMSPGSLADEIWREAHDPLINEEIQYTAHVRISQDLCQEEKEFLARRRKITRVALARYLGVLEKDIHPDDVPTIAMCGSGGGLRALIASTGSMLAAEDDGLFDCVTYTAGVSGSCWLQLLYLSSLAKGRLGSLLEHLKSRAGIHIAYPPVAFDSLTSSPTAKYLLSGLVEKLRGDSSAAYGLVDIYGLLLGARYLVPKGELGVDERDFKISNQRRFLKQGQYPLPIYTAIRHEIPDLDTVPLEAVKEKAKQEAWFQWFEFTPYEFFCEEFGAGIPTWSTGRVFKEGKDVPPEDGFHQPEIRTPLLMGMFGSAFCATLSHYYQEIRPLVQSITGFGGIDEMIHGRNDDLSKVHPIDPTGIPNFAYQMQGKLPSTTPESIYDKEYLELMDAGMSNNLPIYPLLRPGRDVDVLIAFDASADIKTENWLSVVDGYARQRGIKGWPMGVGWPRTEDPAGQTVKELDAAQAESAAKAEEKVQLAKHLQDSQKKKTMDKDEDVLDIFRPNDELAKSEAEASKKGAGDLGFCTVWVGTTTERSTEHPPPSKALEATDSWQLMSPDAGICVVYLPLVENKKVPGIVPDSTDFLSTWNFVYTPEQIDKVVQLVQANYQEGKDQIKSTVRAVYERKKKIREDAERILVQETLRRNSEATLLGEGDQFS